MTTGNGLMHPPNARADAIDVVLKALDTGALAPLDVEAVNTAIGVFVALADRLDAANPRYAVPAGPQ